MIARNNRDPGTAKLAAISKPTEAEKKELEKKQASNGDSKPEEGKEEGGRKKNYFERKRFLNYEKPSDSEEENENDNSINQAFEKKMKEKQESATASEKKKNAFDMEINFSDDDDEDIKFNKKKKEEDLFGDLQPKKEEASLPKKMTPGGALPSLKEQLPALDNKNDKQKGLLDDDFEDSEPEKPVGAKQGHGLAMLNDEGDLEDYGDDEDDVITQKEFV